MRRQAVQDADVHHFRHRMEAFGRRQSEQLSVGSNNKKRTASPCRQDEGMQRIQQWSADVYAQATRPMMKRPRTASEQRHISVEQYDKLSSLSPAAPDMSHSTEREHDMYEAEDVQASFSRYAEAGYAPAPGSYDESQWMMHTPAADSDEFEALSTAMTRESSRTWSPPQTPAAPEFDPQGFSHDFDVSRLSDAERNLLLALGPQSSLAATSRANKSPHHDFEMDFGQYIHMQ